jgi:hypothetical protein
MSAESGIELVVSTTPGGPPTRTLALPIRPQDTSGARTVFVREVAGRAVSGAVLYASPPAGLSVTFARPGGSAPAAALTVDLAAGASVDITIAGTWDDYGEAAVPLLARTDGVRSVAELDVARPGGPPLTVVGAVPGTGLAIASTGPALSTAITVVAGDRRAAEVVARISKLRDAATGKSYKVEQPTVEVGTIEANATANVSLDAAVPYNGSFTGNLQLSHDGITDPPVALTIARTLGPSGVTIDYVPTSSSTFPSDSGDDADTVIRSVVLHETAGRQSTVDPPEFVKPTGKTAEVATGEADVDVVGVALSDDQAASCTKDDASQVITIEPGRQCRVDVTLEVPADAGQYDGTLRFTQPGYTPLDAALSLQMRRTLLAAVVVILLGLVAGGFLKRVLARRRTRLERLSKVERIGRQLDGRVALMPDGIRDDTERRTYVGMRNRLAAIAGEPVAESGGPTDLEEQLATMSALVPVLVPWILLRRAALAAVPPPATTLLADIEEVGTTLAAPGTTKSEAEALPATLTDLEKKLRAHVTTAVRNEIERVKAQVDAWFEPGERTALDAQFVRALAHVADEEGSPEQAHRELATAQGMAAEAMSRRLHELLDEATVPVAMDAGVWAELRLRVQTILTGVGAKPPDAALDAVREADSVLLGGIVAAVTQKVKETRDNYVNQNAPAYGTKIAALNAILGHLAAARAALIRGDLGTAHTEYEEARTGLDQARTSGFLGAAAAGVADAPDIKRPPDGAIVVATDVPATACEPVVDPRWLRWQWSAYEWAIFVLTLVVGVIVGVLALYVGKPTWGSVGDVLAALLWGVGLVPASNAVAQGFGGVRTALTS